MQPPIPSNRLAWVIIAGTLAVGLFGWAVSGRSKQALIVPGDRLLLVGDSLGVGLSKPMAAMAPPGIAFDNASIGGTAVYQWSRESKLDMIRQRQPTVVLISLGTNDAFQQDPGAEDKYLQKLLFELRAMNVRVIWLLPPNVGAPRLDEARAMILAQVPGSQVIDSIDWPIALSGDGIHPTGAGYKDWATRIWRELTVKR